MRVRRPPARASWSYWILCLLLTSCLASCLGAPVVDPALEQAMTALLEASEEPRLMPEPAVDIAPPAVVGPRVSLGVEGMTIVAYFAALQEISGLEFQLAKGVRDSPERLWLRLDQISPDVAVQAGAQAAGLLASKLAWSEQSPLGKSIYRVGGLQDWEHSLKLDALRRQVQPGRWKRFQLTHAKAHQLAQELNAVAGVSDAQMLADTRTNSLILHAPADTLASLGRLIHELDRADSLLRLEAWVLEVDDQLAAALGVNIASNQATGRGAIGDSGAITADNDAASLLDTDVTDAIAGISFVDADAENRLRLTLLRDKGDSRVLSHPRIYVTAGQTAEIFQGEEIPYITRTEQDGQQTEFRQAGLRLKVTPRLVQPQLLSVTVELNKDSVDTTRANPPIARRELQTEMLLPVGATLMIGGIKVQRDSISTSGIPGFEGILGRRNRSRGNAELLVLLKISKVWHEGS